PVALDSHTFGYRWNEQLVTAATLFQGAGVVISIIAVLCWLAALVRRCVRFWTSEAANKPRWGRFALVGGGMAAVATFVLTAVPWPGSVTAPAIVQYRPETTVRAQCDGFVRRVHVQGGDHVTEGQVLMVMHNEELDHELKLLELDGRQSRVQRRMYVREGELAKAQAELRQLQKVEKELAEKREDHKRLIVRAPCSGQVVGRNLRTLKGRYQEKGGTLLSIGQAVEKEVRLAISQEDVPAFRGRVGRVMRVYFPRREPLQAPLAKVEPRGSLVPLDVSLCAPNGGLLAVREVSRKPGDEQRPEGLEYELLSPHFTGIVSLAPDQSTRVRSGQRARVALRPTETIGQHLYHLLAEWVEVKLSR
ncbi:MAG: efflux RND transporter periplasmic adaptor subunit, partial [Planctomycetota bacterium]